MRRRYLHGTLTVDSVLVRASCQYASEQERSYTLSKQAAVCTPRMGKMAELGLCGLRHRVRVCLLTS